ncbi:hypothetical protein CDL12_21082 [Handroanthus impetiginosus]|uniref:Transcription factor, Myb superfamily n=1 Tax=Handroanthus impetiginosus TaxID=429701 RepID=A0A2G9GMX4_9LAMI|nr:hypothetical protein CDL12_21082 [Handroanthus impetiginosus]
MVQMGAYDQEGWKKGPWTPEEDRMLVEYISQYGEGRWSSVSKCTGLKRNGKSCRLRWVNYLRPGLKKGHLTPQEEGIIIELHALWGNRWSTIARYLPGRTDNEIKNYWRTHFKKRKQENKTILTQQQQEEINQNKNFNKLTSTDENNINQETATVHPSNENHQIVPTIYQDSDLWSDFVPMDCYLWDGLWNLDDQDGCSKDENRANVGDYFQSGGYIFH